MPPAHETPSLGLYCDSPLCLLVNHLAHKINIYQGSIPFTKNTNNEVIIFDTNAYIVALQRKAFHNVIVVSPYLTKKLPKTKFYSHQLLLPKEKGVQFHFGDKEKTNKSPKTFKHDSKTGDSTTTTGSICQYLGNKI